MKPAIDQMIAYLEGEMAKYSAPASYMDKGYRVLEQSRKQAEKIKERCDAGAAVNPDRLYSEPESKAWAFGKNNS